ncbi:hypothetical protein LR948_01535 [Roseivivax sp. GX 12232]|uniref:hypothetical protein n=1 Tax=Roseivivax sp. GX 12232 TaxID=2900547 RepID=UPI001E425FE6|nr:hypothetical protein [Roseivivax sp. GX 12232]MCE0504028.1 hypothetical protein [Roseivivax sp. GX 12232]
MTRPLATFCAAPPSAPRNRARAERHACPERPETCWCEVLTSALEAGGPSDTPVEALADRLGTRP